MQSSIQKSCKDFVVVFVIIVGMVANTTRAGDAEILLLDFVDRWQEIKEFDVSVELDIGSKSTSGKVSENWLRHSNVRFAKADKKLFLAVEISSVSEEDLGEVSYKYMEIENRRWFSDGSGKVLSASEKMRYENVEISFLNSMQYKPFTPWVVMVFGEHALFRGSAADTDLDKVMKIDKIIQSSEVAKGTHAVVLAPGGSIVYEILFDNDYGGMPSLMNVFPYHDKIHLENPSKNTRPFYMSKLTWEKKPNGWFVKRAVVESVDGQPPHVVKGTFDSRWTWSDKVDATLFSQPGEKPSTKEAK